VFDEKGAVLFFTSFKFDGQIIETALHRGWHRLIGRSWWQ